MKLLIPFFALFTSIQLNAQWQDVNNLQTGSWMGNIHAISNDTLVIGLDDGRIYFSDNKGVSFSVDTLPFPFSWINDFSFADNSIGFACGGTAFGQFRSPIAKTMDGGKSWDSISTNKFGYELYSSHFLNADTGYFGGQSIIVKTMDGGQSFSVDSLPNSFRITDIHFTDESTGFYISNDNIHKTTDAGQNWNVVFNDTFPSFQPGFKKLQFHDKDNGIVLSNRGYLLSTSDAGNSWHYNITSPDSLPITDFDFLNRNTGYAICREFSTLYSGRIYKTVDGGSNWTLQHEDTTQLFLAMDMANEDNGFVLGTESIISTHNGGMTLPLLNMEGEFEIYPNPVKQTFFIKTSSGISIDQINILDLNGKLLRTLNSQLDNKWNISDLPEAYYILQIKTAGNIYHQKLIVGGR